MALRVISSQSLFDTDSSKDDGGELGRLMHDFRAKEAKEMQAGALKDRVHELKETEKGVEHMCKEMEALRLEGVEEGRLEEKRENAKSMAEDGMTVDRIAKILKVNAQMVQEWLAGSVSTASQTDDIGGERVPIAEGN